MAKKFMPTVAMFALIALLLSGLPAQQAEASPDMWLQTTQADFEAGTQNNVEVIDIGGGDGDVKLATFSNTVTDTFNDETKIAFKSNIVVTGGQVKLTSAVGTETLRPDGAGDSTSLSVVGPPNWQASSSDDSDTSYVWTTGAGWSFDLYQLSDPVSLTGTINSVTVYIKARSLVTPDQEGARTAIKTGGATSKSAFIELITTYATYSTTYATNPQTGSAWTWAQIVDLQAGVDLRRSHPDADPTSDRASRATQVYVEVNYTVYDSPGTLTSVNLLSGEAVASIDSFGYNASAIPSGTGLRVQFSQDGSTWYKSDGTLGGWDDLTVGTHSIDLSALGWSGANFYYKMEFTSDGTETPVLDEISVTYSSYYSSGTLTSSIYDAGVQWTNWGTMTWSETPNGQTINMKVRTSDDSGMLGATDWASAPVVTNGQDISGLSSVSDGHRYIQYRSELSTSDTSQTPVLHDVTINYSHPAAESSDSVGVGQDTYRTGDNVYACGCGFPATTSVNVYIVSDRAWTDGDTIPADVGDGMSTITTDDDGNCGPDMVWQAPLTPGAYDLVFDVNQNGVYNFIEDCIDDPNHPGFIVQQLADFTATPRQGLAPLTVQFTDLSPDNVTSWLWDFGDGGTGTEQNPFHTYSTPGTYTVSLTVTGPGGTDSEVKTDYIEVFAVPARIIVRNLLIQPAQAYPGQQLTISADVVNQGGTRGSRNIELVINGQAEQSIRVGVDPGAAEHITFFTSKTVPGTYEVFIEGQASAFNVLLRPHVTSTGAFGGLSMGAIIAIVVIGVIFLVGIIIVFIRVRRPA